MERAEIIKALEKEYDQRHKLEEDLEIELNIAKNLKNALALIKELQAHNENLKKENKYLRERRDEETEHAKDLAITDTVKKMQDKLKAAFCPDADYFGRDIHSAINEKAKEILNESQ